MPITVANRRQADSWALRDFHRLQLNRVVLDAGLEHIGASYLIRLKQIIRGIHCHATDLLHFLVQLQRPLGQQHFVEPQLDVVAHPKFLGGIFLLGLLNLLRSHVLRQAELPFGHDFLRHRKALKPRAILVAHFVAFVGQPRVGIQTLLHPIAVHGADPRRCLRQRRIV